MLAGSLLAEKAITIQEQFDEARNMMDESFESYQQKVAMALTIVTVIANILIVWVFLRCKLCCNLNSTLLPYYTVLFQHIAVYCIVYVIQLQHYRYPAKYQYQYIAVNSPIEKYQWNAYA